MFYYSLCFKKDKGLKSRKREAVKHFGQQVSECPCHWPFRCSDRRQGEAIHKLYDFCFLQLLEAWQVQGSSYSRLIHTTLISVSRIFLCRSNQWWKLSAVLWKRCLGSAGIPQTGESCLFALTRLKKKRAWHNLSSLLNIRAGSNINYQLRVDK